MILKILYHKKIDPSKDIIDEVNGLLKKYILSLMQPLERKDFFNAQDKLSIILVSGVNGVGKATSIGKIESLEKIIVRYYFLPAIHLERQLSIN